MPSAKPRILYVDDDEGARLMLTLLFGQQGYEVTALSTSQATQFIVPDEPYSLYILGPLPPGMDGAVFCRKILELERDAPIIIHSDAAPKSDQEAALAIDELLNTVKVELDL